MLKQLQGRAEGATLNLMRIVVGLLFWSHGAQKMLGWFGRSRVEDIFSRSGLAGALELIGGFAIMIGLFTRPVAFILSGQMAFAYFISHARGLTLPIENRGELAVLYCFVFLFMAAAGGGRFSVDGLIRKKRK